MKYFGDASGHLRNLLHGECEVYVAGVVGGDPNDCLRCPKRAVRRVSDIDEARWADLQDVQKRRLFDCFVESDISFGYVKITAQQLQQLEHSYLLYQNVSFPPDWDLAVEAHAYAEILRRLTSIDRETFEFVFDRIIANKQSNAVANQIEQIVGDVSASFISSHSSHGVQAADCFAGAVAEDHKSDTARIEQVDQDTAVPSQSVLSRLEERLVQHEPEP